MKTNNCGSNWKTKTKTTHNNNMKKLKVIITVAVLVMVGIGAVAQPTKPITYADGGASNAFNFITAPGTNTYYLSCSEVDTLPTHIKVKAHTAATSTVQLFAYRALANDDYETSPTYSQLLTLSGTIYVGTLTNLNVQGAATLKFVIGNTNATIPVTNISFITRPKAAKRAVFDTSR